MEQELEWEGGEGRCYDVPHRACEWAMHLMNMGRSHSSRRLAGVRGGVGGGETLRAGAEFGRDGQLWPGPSPGICTLAPVVDEAVEEGTRAGLFVCF